MTFTTTARPWPASTPSCSLQRPSSLVDEYVGNLRLLAMSHFLIRARGAVPSQFCAVTRRKVFQSLQQHATFATTVCTKGPVDPPARKVSAAMPCML